MSLIRGGSYAYCLDTNINGQFAGYVARFTHTTLQWSKYWEGSEADENVLQMPWIGLSRSCLVGTYDVYKYFVGVFMKFRYAEFLVMLYISNGSIANINKIAA